MATNQADGFVYALDADPSRPENRLLIIDSNTGDIVRELSTGYVPIIASTQSRRLFLLDARIQEKPWRAALTELDPSNGRILNEATLPGSYPGYIVVPFTSGLVPSHDGHWLFVSMMETRISGTDEHWIQVFDTQRFVFLPERLLLGNNCDPHLMPSSDNHWLYVGCWATSTLYRFDLSTSRETGKFLIPGGTQDSTRMVMTPGRPAGFALASNDKHLYIVTHDARLIELEPNTLTIVRVTSLALSPDRYLPDFRLLISSNGARLYLGIGKLGVMQGQKLADQVLVLDATNGKMIEILEVSMPFSFGWQLSRDGRTFYLPGSVDARQMAKLDLTTKTTQVFNKPGRLIISLTVP